MHIGKASKALENKKKMSSIPVTCFWNNLLVIRCNTITVVCLLQLRSIFTQNLNHFLIQLDGHTFLRFFLWCIKFMDILYNKKHNSKIVLSKLNIHLKHLKRQHAFYKKSIKFKLYNQRDTVCSVLMGLFAKMLQMKQQPTTQLQQQLEA